jgi:simple sugar transport system ATP-binding protein
MPSATEPRFVAEVSGVSKSFRNTRALSDVSMRVTAGRQHALLGRNGAGKSTLVSILTGIVPPDSGTISFEGRASPPRSAPEQWRAKVTCVYQQSSLVPSLSVVENLFLNKLPKTALGLVAWSCARHEAEKALSSWGLDIDVDAAVSKLTVVQKQLVEIVRALLQGSRFIILDEPTAHLEPGEIAKLFERMRGLVRRHQWSNGDPDVYSGVWYAYPGHRDANSHHYQFPHRGVPKRHHPQLRHAARTHPGDRWRYAGVGGQFG